MKVSRSLDLRFLQLNDHCRIALKVSSKEFAIVVL
jgi:hypothetical protein